MKVRQLGISITIVIAVTLSLYLLIATQILQDPVSTQPDSASPGPLTEAKSTTTATLPETASSDTMASAAVTHRLDTGGGRKQLEIHGRIVDSELQPIANVLIAEERYFHQARSDAEGYYRLQLEMPRHRYPVLHFLRSGYAGQRLKLDKKQLGDRLRYQLDVTLQQALESVSLNGRVGDEFGIGLAAARVQLNASYPRNRDSFYLTEFTDELGNFGFEGIDADQIYKLSASLSPDYQAYENPGLRVELDPAPLEIVLQKLKFVDIDGMILNRESVPVPNYKMQISNLTTGKHRSEIVSDSSGFFSLERFPVGAVSLTTRGHEFFKTAGLEITETHYQNLKIVIDRGDHFLSGWISDENGIAVEKAMITLDRSFEDNGVSNLSYRSQATDSNGGFSFAGLGGGSYHVTVYAQNFDKQDFEYRFEDQAGEIYVTLERSR